MPRLHFPGVGGRIAARLIELGYQREGDGKPDAGRFCKEHRYDARIFYEWLGDRKTPSKDLDRLVADLQTSKGWLFFGESSSSSIAASRHAAREEGSRRRLRRRSND